MPWIEHRCLCTFGFIFERDRQTDAERHGAGRGGHYGGPGEQGDGRRTVPDGNLPEADDARRAVQNLAETASSGR